MNFNRFLGCAIRHEFPIFKNNEKQGPHSLLPFVYLDSAASAQKPRVVIEAMTRHLEHDYGAVHRGAYGVSIRSSQMYENIRAQVAAFVGPSVQPEQVVFTKGTTESLNIVANGLAKEVLNEQDRIVTSVAEHHANLIPWQQAALGTNCELAYIPLCGTQGHALRLDLAKAEKLMTKNTKVLTVASVGNVLGQKNPVLELMAMAKKRGAFVVLDCAQGLPCGDGEDVFSQGADAVALSSHKMYGPSGVGVLVMSPKLMGILPPLLFGGGMISQVSLEESSWATGPAKFEAGSPPVTEVVGLGAALAWIEKKGKKNIEAHCCFLAQLFLEELKKIKDLEIFAPETGQETLVSFRHHNIHAHDFATFLDASNIAMRAGQHCAWPLVQFLGKEALLRCSFGAYCDTDDVRAAIGALKNTITNI
jgi:cysteine desulfurase/selenocysteine lyase